MGWEKADLPDEAAMAKAEKVIAQASAKAKVPSSLSSIPAAATPPADELQALSSMSVQQVQDKLMSMPREKNTGRSVSTDVAGHFDSPP